MNPTNQPQQQPKAGSPNQSPNQYGQPNQQGRQGEQPNPNTYNTPHEGEKPKSNDPTAKSASPQGNQQNR